MTAMDKKLQIDELEKVTGGVQAAAAQPEVTNDGTVETPQQKKGPKIHIPKPQN